MDVGHRVESLEHLETLYRRPGDRASSKVFDRIDSASSKFIDYVTFVVLSTSSRDGSIDASPRGGPAGFISQLDDRTVAMPDLVGNNRLDSFRNIIDNPFAGLLLIVPGKDETLRINGKAHLSVDPGILDAFSGELRRPKVAIVVQIDELFGHCAKAFRRGRVWEPASWSSGSEAPDLAEIYSCQFDSIDAVEMRSTIDDIYTSDLAEDRP